MAYKPRYLSTAYRDILEADEYMSGESPDKAWRFFGLIKKKLLQLQVTPFMYKIYEDYPAYRRIVIMDYLVFYIVNEADSAIDVHRVTNGKTRVVNRLSGIMKRSITKQPRTASA